MKWFKIVLIVFLFVKCPAVLSQLCENFEIDLGKFANNCEGLFLPPMERVSYTDVSSNFINPGITKGNHYFTGSRYSCKQTNSLDIEKESTLTIYMNRNGSIGDEENILEIIFIEDGSVEGEIFDTIKLSDIDDWKELIYNISFAGKFKLRVLWKMMVDFPEIAIDHIFLESTSNECEEYLIPTTTVTPTTEESTEPTDSTEEPTDPTITVTPTTEESTETTEKPIDPTDPTTTVTPTTEESTEPTEKPIDPTDPTTTVMPSTEESTESTDLTEKPTDPTDLTEEPTDSTTESISTTLVPPTDDNFVFGAISITAIVVLSVCLLWAIGLTIKTLLIKSSIPVASSLSQNIVENGHLKNQSEYHIPRANYVKF